MKKSFLIFIVVLISSCEYYDDRLKITNKSNIEIVVGESNYKDSIAFNEVGFYLMQDHIIKPNSTLRLGRLGGVKAWNNRIQNSPQKKIFIYIFAVDTLKKYEQKYTMHDLYVLDKYIKRFELSEKQLDDIHWEVMFNLPR